VYYFVLTDRFEDGDPANNARGGGYDPTDPHAYHGGDLAGLQSRLDYLEALGVNAIWVTPIFQNQAVQGSTSAYHGYWITDFLKVDPHLGTNGEFHGFVQEAQGRGMRVFLDIITNHTADVNRYYTGSDTYVPKASAPYLDARGTPFDDRDYAWDGRGDPFFPELDEAVSFPLRPYIPPQKQNLRNPGWLNDVTNYHNRGASTFFGENSLYGDFFGLDDLFTEKPEVVRGMIDIYSYWIEEYGVDGYRIDTVKHVNPEFWKAFAPAIRETAINAGRAHFYQFGEVFNFDPAFLSEFSTVLPLDATLDFAFAGEVRAFAYQSGSSAKFYEFFSRDDLLTDADSHANARPLFIGNHDIGRAAAYAQADNPGAGEAEILDRLELALALKFFCRGQPVIYYGDEQGFAGAGASDIHFREDMMPSATPLYQGMDLVGTTATPAQANFDRGHPLFTAIAGMADLYHTYPALRLGAQIARASGSSSVFAISRLHRADLVEYLFVASNATGGSESLSLPTLQRGGADFTRIGASRPDAAPGRLTTSDDGRVSLSMDGLQWALYKAEAPLADVERAPSLAFSGIRSGSVQTVQTYSQDGYEFPGRLEIAVETEVADYAEVSFWYHRSDRPAEWQSLGVDTAPPYRVFFRPPEEIPAGVTYSFGAALDDRRGNTKRTVVRDVLVARGTPVNSLILHYQREDGLYADWGIVAEGAGLAGGRAGSEARPLPFIGETGFGAFAVVPVEDPTAPVRFVVQKANGQTAPEERTWQGRHSAVPQATAEIWIRHGERELYPSRGEAEGHVDLHYRRTTTGASGWRMEVRDAVSGDLVTMLAPFYVTGASARYRLEPGAFGMDWGREVALRPVHGDLGVEGPVREMPLRAAGAFWLKEGTGTAFRGEAAMNNVAVIHYRRPAGDYGDPESSDYRDYWGLHVWSGAANPTEWNAPLAPVRKDAFGVVFEVPLQAGAASLSYLLHRGDAKDPGPDQSLSPEAAGYEVWQLQGADPEAPYLRTTGKRALYGGFLSPGEAAQRANLEITPDGRVRFYAPMGRRMRLEETTTVPGMGGWKATMPAFLGTGGTLESDLPTPLRRNFFYRLLVE
jgi:glycosidase